MANSKKFKKQIKRKAHSNRIFDDVIDLASSLFRNRQALGADRLASLAEATREYAASMTDLPTLQRQVNLASENLGNLADYVMNTDIKHMVSDATVLARRRPLLTLGVAAAAGLAASRWIITSSTPTAPGGRRRIKKKSGKPSVGAARTMNGATHAHT